MRDTVKAIEDRIHDIGTTLEDKRKKTTSRKPRGVSKATLAPIFDDDATVSIAEMSRRYGLDRSALNRWLNGQRTPQRAEHKAIVEEILTGYDYIKGQGLRAKN